MSLGFVHQLGFRLLNLQPLISRGLFGGLFIVLVWFVGAWVAQSLDKPQAPLVLSMTNNPPPSGSRSGRLNLLYGQTDKPVSLIEQPKLDAESLTDTRLKLVLLGTIKTGRNGVAIILHGANNLVVAEGEQVINGVELVEVAADYVVLLHRGKHERLVMEDRIAGLVTQKADSANVVSVSSLAELDQTRLKAINDEIRQNPMKMGNYVRFKGIKQNGNWVGIEVSPRREHKIFEAMGLKPGDLIKSINGQQIKELADAPTLWNRFLQEHRFNLQVERNGMLETVSVDLTNLAE